MTRLRALLPELSKFGVVGLATYVLTVIVSNTLRFGAPRLGPLTSLALAMLLAASVSYLANRHWTWRHTSRRSPWREYPLFIVLSVVGFGLSEIPLGVSEYVLRLHSALAYNVAGNLVGTAVGTVWRYLAFKRWIFYPVPTDTLPAATGGTKVESGVQVPAQPLRDQARDYAHTSAGRPIVPAEVHRPTLRRQRVQRHVATSLDVAILAALTTAIGVRYGALSGFPKGWDALGHLAKVKELLAAWPHINWNGAWYAGIPNFTGSYPPGYHLLVAAIAHLGVSLPTAMLAVTGLSMLLLVGGTYGFVRVVASSRVLGWIAALILIAQPTLWSQSLELGLYPRLLALGLGAAALPAAAAYARSPSRRRGAGMVLLLAAALSVHPVIGLLVTVFAAIAVWLLSGGRTVGQRLSLLGPPGLLLGLLVAYFYLPLVLLPRSQGTFTNFEVPTSWSRLLSPQSAVNTGIEAWSPILVPLIIVVTVGLVLAYRGPAVHTSGGGTIRGFCAQLRRLRTFRRDSHPTTVLVTWCALFASAVLAYCLIGHVDPHFPLYVNGLQPDDLIVYPAWFAAIGIALCLGLVRRRWQPSWSRTVIALPLIVAVGGVSLLAVYLPNQAIDHNDSWHAELEQMITGDVPVTPDYRIAAGSDLTAEWINYYTATPETDGYQQQGDLHLPWQAWLQQSIATDAQSNQVRRFLFNWYGVRWALVQDGAPYDHHSRVFADVDSRTVPTTASLWRYRHAAPIATATNALPVLCICDETHYDLLLRAFAASDTNSNDLIPVDGGDSLDPYSVNALRAYSAVVVYGAPVQSEESAQVLRSYVDTGGHAVVDEGEGIPMLPPDRNPVGAIRTTTVQQSWGWNDSKPNLLPPALLRQLPPPNYAGGDIWQIGEPRHLPSDAHVVANADGHTVIAQAAVGAGTFSWSGLNLPYLAASDDSKAAGNLLALLTTGTAHPHASVIPVTTRQLNPENWRFSVPAGATSLLVRQYNANDWAAIDTATGLPLPVETAGPGMTLIRLNGDATSVALIYRLSLVERGGIYVSGVGVLAFLLYALGVAWPIALRRRLSSLRELVRKPSWWDRNSVERRFDLEEALASPDPSIRRVTLRAMTARELERNAEALWLLSQEETDGGVLDALFDLIASNQWNAHGRYIVDLQLWAFEHRRVADGSVATSTGWATERRVIE